MHYFLRNHRIRGGTTIIKKATNPENPVIKSLFSAKKLYVHEPKPSAQPAFIVPVVALSTKLLMRFLIA